ncbi:MAG TPA: cupredoxin domain-containing protein [Acidimicrobiia bacterium]|nr:cupredoxin domain-containing protein [Acidimicrobiia bacterium]
MIMMFLVAIGVAVAVTVTVVATTRAVTQHRVGDRSTAPEANQAQRVLAERFATGEIEVSEYRERRALLEQANTTSGPVPNRARLPVALATALVVVLVAAVIAVGVAAGSGDWWGMMGRHMGWSGSGSSGASTEPFVGAEGVTVDAGDLWFEPSTIEIRADEPVNLALRNRGGIFHDLTIPAFDFVLEATSGDTVTGGLTGAPPGEYEFYCSVPGHADGGMTGTLDVVAG